MMKPCDSCEDDFMSASEVFVILGKVQRHWHTREKTEVRKTVSIY